MGAPIENVAAPKALEPCAHTARTRERHSAGTGPARVLWNTPRIVRKKLLFLTLLGQFHNMVAEYSWTIQMRGSILGLSKCVEIF